MSAGYDLAVRPHEFDQRNRPRGRDALSPGTRAHYERSAHFRGLDIERATLLRFDLKAVYSVSEQVAVRSHPRGAGGEEYPPGRDGTGMTRERGKSLGGGYGENHRDGKALTTAGADVTSGRQSRITHLGARLFQNPETFETVGIE